MSVKAKGYIKPNRNKEVRMSDDAKGVSFDITFCLEDCDNIHCFRNKKRILENEVQSRYPHSFSELRDTENCPSYCE